MENGTFDSGQIGEARVCEPALRWREENGIIRFNKPLLAPGISGEEWIKRLGSKNYAICPYVMSVLRSRDFQPLAAGAKVEIVVVKGKLFRDNYRTPADIRAEAQRRKFLNPCLEIACLVRDQFTDEGIGDMGLWAIIAMHDPIEDACGDRLLLGAFRSAHKYDLDTYQFRRSRICPREHGFAFLAE